MYVVPVWRQFFGLVFLLFSVGTVSGSSDSADESFLPTVQPAAQATPLPSLDISDLDHQYLRQPAEFVRVPRGTPWSEVQGRRFRPLTGQSVNQGITDDDIWIRVRLDNASGEYPVSWVLYSEISYLDEIEIHGIDSSGAVIRELLTDRLPFHDRPLDYRTLAFPHQTAAGGHTDLYIRLGYVKADAMSLNLGLMETTEFQSMTRSEYLAYGVYYGLMLALMLLAALCALTLRSMVYLYYVGFLGFGTLMWTLLNGFGYQYLWPASVFWQNEGFHIVYLLMVACALKFSRGFLHTSRYLPRIDRIIQGLQWLMLLGVLARFAGFYGPVLWLSFVAMGLMSLLAIVGVLAYRKGMLFARWYILAWLVYGAALLVSVISAGSNLLNWGMISLIFAQAGSAIEAIFLAFALAERLFHWEQDRRNALQLAQQDPLTGLGNRRALNAAFEVFGERYREQGVPVFLLMIDLDHFKEVNDDFGHDAGDQVLREFGALLRRLSRPEDACIRFGGEEFAMLLQVADVKQAQEVAERIRREFAEQPTAYRTTIISHTLTVGLAEIFSANEILTRDEMFRRADAALYQAKGAGRNRIFVYNAEAVT